MPAAHAVVTGARRLAERPLAVAFAMLGGAASSLAAAGTHSATVRMVLRGHAASALAFLLLGVLASALLAAFALTAAVAASVRPDAPLEEVLAPAPRSAATIVLLRLGERLLLTALLLSALAPALRFAVHHPSAPPTTMALASVASLAPPLLLGLLTVPAFRVAVARAAAGERAMAALADGARFVLLGFGLLLRLAVVGVLASSPLWLLAIALGRLDGGPAARLAVTALRGALTLVAAAWLYGAQLALASESTSPIAPPPMPAPATPPSESAPSPPDPSAA